MIIDSHAHLKHGDARRTEYTPAEVVRAMDGAGIDRSVVFAMATDAFTAVDMAANAVLQFPDRLIPYAYALPSYEWPVVDELRRALQDLGFRGIKLHIGECTMAEYVSGPVFSLASQLRVPCLVDFGGRLDACQAVLEDHPDTTVIVAHFGRYLCRDAGLLDSFIELAVSHPNCVLDTSGVVLLEKIEEAVKRIGAGRVVFGTDGPHADTDGTAYADAADTASFARAAVQGIRSLNIRADDQAAILGGSIARLLRL